MVIKTPSKNPASAIIQPRGRKVVAAHGLHDRFFRLRLAGIE